MTLDDYDKERIVAVMNFAIAGDLDGLKSLEDVEFVYGVEWSIVGFDEFEIKFHEVPKEVFDYADIDPFEDETSKALAIDIPYWTKAGPSDLYLDLWVDLLPTPHKIWVKGHRIP